MLVGNGAEGKEIEVPYYLLPLMNVNTCFTLVLTYTTYLSSAVLCVKGQYNMLGRWDDCLRGDAILCSRQAPANKSKLGQYDDCLIDQASDVPSCIIFFINSLQES